MEPADTFGARILIADDDLASVRLLEQILSRAGYTNVASTTDPACVALAFAGPTPDLLILDIHMPGRDGFEVLAEVKPYLAPGDDVPSMIVTGDVTPEMRRRALVAGVDDFVLKPLQATEVVMRAEHLIGHRFAGLASRGIAWEPGPLAMPAAGQPVLRLVPGGAEPPEPSLEALLLRMQATLATPTQFAAFEALREALSPTGPRTDRASLTASRQ
jgi:CheY-like chemotaxis protein